MRRQRRRRDARHQRRRSSGSERYRRGKPSITPYTQRTTEVYLAHRLGIVPREALGQGTGPLAARAAHLTRALADRFRLNHNLLEVYPKGTLAALGFVRPYKKHLKERETRAEILEALSPELRFGPGVWRELCIQSDHLFDAVICAFTGYLWARDAWTLPPRRSPAATAGSGCRRCPRRPRTRRRRRPRGSEAASLGRASV